VFEALSVDGIVRNVTTLHSEQADSDEDEEDNFVEPSLNASQAIDCARDLPEYVMAVPEAFAPADVKALDDTMHKMMHVSFQKKTQPTLHELWDMQYVLFMLCARVELLCAALCSVSQAAHAQSQLHTA
jgi:hypothetical protein